MSPPHIWARKGEWQPSPGPWYYDPKKHWVRDKEDIGVAKVWLQGIHDVSNARLITEAPVMLDLLRQALEELDPESNVSYGILALVIQLESGT